MSKKEKAASPLQRETAVKNKTTTARRVQQDSADVKRSAALLLRLEEAEEVLHGIWASSQNPDVAYTWLYCVHNLRQVARDLRGLECAQ